MNFIQLKSGTSVEGEEIKAFQSECSAKKYIYLIAGVHGDEVEGAYCLNQIFTWLQSNDEISELPLIVIPILNVDGYRAETRVNSNGVDLNRNLNTNCWTSEASLPKYFPGKSPLSEPENQFLIKLFKKFPPSFIQSIHSWKPLVNFNGDCEDVAEYLSTHNNYETCADIGYPTPGSLGTYGSENLKCPVLTFECPVLSDENSLKSIWNDNEAGFKGLFTDGIYDRFLD